MRRVAFIAAVMLCGCASVPKGPTNTAEGIFRQYRDVVYLDEKGLEKFIEQLGHTSASIRKRALKKAARLDYISLTTLLRELRASDGPELQLQAILLKPQLAKAAAQPGRETINIIHKAVRGDAYAQGALGLMFMRGYWGLSRDHAEARRWAQKSADQKHPMGLFALACIYEDRGISYDSRKSRLLFAQCANGLKELAEQGKARAQHNLGRMYECGTGVETDQIEAFELYKLAAEHGYPRAEYDLARVYQYGIGCQTNYVAAAKWYRKVAEKGDLGGQYSLGQMYRLGRGVEMSSKEAVKWYRKSAELKGAQGQAALGWCYANGKGVRQDHSQAATWYTRAAEQGDSYAQFSLAQLWQTGKGVPGSIAEAVKWYTMAAEQGNASAQLKLSTLYSVNIFGLGRDDARALMWCRKAAEQGNAQAQYRLGRMYCYGTGVDKDLAKATEWYRKAATQGLPDAQYSLGCMYYYGTGVEQDYTEALAWYTKAMKGMNVSALNAMAWLRATCPDERLRDGTRAVELAEELYSKGTTWARLDTLAAAYACDGQFEKAVETQKKANALLERKEPGKKKDLEGQEARLKLYEQGKAYVQE